MKRGHDLIAATILLFCALAGAEIRSQPVASNDRITLTGQVELPRLVDTAAQQLHVNIEYDAAAVKGQVTLRLDGPLSDEELWQLLNRILAARGFTTVQLSPVGGRAAFSVVKTTDAAAVAAIRPPGAHEAPGVSVPPAAGFQTVVIRAKHRSAKELVDQLGKAIGRQGPAAAGLTVLGDSGLLVISDLSARIEQMTALLDLLDSPGSKTVIEPIPVANIGAAQMVTLLTQLAAKRDAVSGEKTPGEVLPAPDGNAVLLVAPESAVEQWRTLVATLDKREALETATYTPGHFPARDVARLIEQTMKGGGQAGTAGGVGGPAGSIDDRMRVVIDELTGSLVITGTPTQHEAIRALMERLDSVPASARRPVRTFVIKNRPVDEVVSVLQELLRAGVLDAAAKESESVSQPLPAPGPLSAAVTPMPPPPQSTPPGTPSGSAAAAPGLPAASSGPFPAVSRAYGSSNAVSPVGALRGSDEPPVTLTVDKGTNTLIAVGEPRVLEQIEKLLLNLDVRQPQVMLEVLLVTLNDGQTMDLGVELEKLEVSGSTLIRLSSLFGLGSRGSGGDRDGPANAAGFTGVVLNPGDFSVVLRALETLNRGRSVSMPKLLVGNNEQATLDSVVQQPFASVNASNTVSTTSFGGTQDAGTVVTIQPQIAEGDHLLLQYSVSLSSFLGPASSATLPPPRQQNRVQSVATIPDGFTVVVGGLEIENKSNAVSQIPLLGSIPVLGEAFKSRNNADSHSKFYVFIRANILRGGSGANGGFEDLKYLSEKDIADAAVDDGFPEMKPRIIR
jgi:general secretion pathway protein D